MFEIINNSNDPYFNLALEEYAAKNIKIDSLFIIWQNSPVVVIGNNQNTLEEVKMDFLTANDIALVRRISGGGAVYHDLGNINFTFVAAKGKEVGFDFVRFTAPIIKTLDKIGIKAEHSGRNDLTIGGRKFSGNAQFRFGDRVMHHGTLLYKVNLENMVQALNVSEEKILAKGVKSVYSRVTNISEHLPQELSTDEFKHLLLQNLRQEAKVTDTYELSSEDIRHINQLKDSKYKSWAWNVGQSPAYNIRKQQRFEWGSIELRFKLSGEIIKSCKIYGDFFAAEDISLLEQEFEGINYNPESLATLLSRIDLTIYLPNANRDEIRDLLLSEN